MKGEAPISADLASVSVTRPAALSWAVLNAQQRILHGLMALACALVLLVAHLLTPDPRGVGTHEQLGLPACLTLTALHIPCPFCGMTTAFSLAAHGRLAQALATQPAGALGFCMVVLLEAFYVSTAIAGRRLATKVSQDRLRRGMAIGAAIILAAWIYKVFAVLT